MNLDHRGACGCEANTGDGAGILMQVPHKFLQEGRRRVRDSLCPSRASYGVGMCFTSPDAAARAKSAGALRRDRGRRRPDGARLARHSDRQLDARQHGEERASRSCGRCSSSAARIARTTGLRAQALRHPQARAMRKSARRSRTASGICPSLSCRTMIYKGHAHARAGRTVFPRPARPGHGDRAGAGAFALLHEHLPELGALASVSLHRAQRRDQHAARQHQLDARARRRCSRATLFGDDIKKILPIVNTNGSDSAMFDNCPRTARAGAAARCRTR